MIKEGLEKYVLTTLAYYDVSDYPLTSFEIWKYLMEVQSSRLPRPGTGGQAKFSPPQRDPALAGKVQSSKEKYSLYDVIKELGSEQLKKNIDEYRGFYFLKGRQNIAEQRIKRNKISEKKYKILLRVAKILRFIPFVRMIAATGRMAMKNAEEKSDLDLLIVLEHGKIFTGRTLVTLAVHLLGKRRYKEKIANRICLNYFITTKSLEIGLKDLYSASEYSFALPLFGWEIFKKFQQKNSWIKEHKINHQGDIASNLKLLKDTRLAKLARRAGEKLIDFDFIENTLKKWQIKRINKNPKTHQAGSEVAAGDEALIFLPSPQGPRIYGKFQENLNDLTKF